MTAIHKKIAMTILISKKVGFKTETIVLVEIKRYISNEKKKIYSSGK